MASTCKSISVLYIVQWKQPGFYKEYVGKITKGLCRVPTIATMLASQNNFRPIPLWPNGATSNHFF